MSRSSDGRALARVIGCHGAAGAWASAASLLGTLAGAPMSAGAQLPPRTRPTPADTVRRDTVRTDSARVPVTRADSARRAVVSDSTQRDSIVARQLRAARRRDPVGTRFNLDRLRLSAVGASGGVAMPDQVTATTLYAVHADYGEVAPDVHAVFGLMYWSSAYRASAVDGFARAIATAAAGDGPPPTVTIGRVRASDVELHADLHWRPRTIRGWRTPGALRPWLAGGAGVHLLDVQGAPISGTFVERALDGVAFGAAGGAGVDILPTRSVQVTGEIRYDLFSGAHFASARAGLSYVFDGRGR